MSFKLMDVNLVDQATITSSTENALFPLNNIKDTRRSKVFRSTTNSDSIVFDLQETSEIDTVFVVADKRAGFGVSTITIEFNGTDSWGSPAFSVSVPLSVSFGIGYTEFTKINYRFARIVMTSTLGYCELSKVYIGKKLELVRSINFGWSQKDEELSQKQFNRYGQMFTDVIARQRAITFTMQNMDKNDLALVNSCIDRVGETKPLWFIIGCSEMIDDNRRISGPYILNDIPTIVNAYFNKYSLTMNTRELM